MKKYTCLLSIVLTALLFSCLLSACESSDPSTLKTYRFGRDKVPSITSVVGERTVAGVETEGKNEFPSMQYTYESNSVFDDLSQYIELLQEQGWITTADGYNLQEIPGSVQFAKESADKGQLLVIVIDYQENEYAIKITKLEAALNQPGSDVE